VITNNPESIIVDTCGWIEWLTDGVLCHQYAPYFERMEVVIVPTSIQFELYKWVCRVKNKQMALEAVALTKQGKVLALSTSIALLAADASAQYKLSFADAIIYASAQINKAVLITSDDHFEGLPDVVYFSKKAR
jgi:predicted nucleic acid-binding protein